MKIKQLIKELNRKLKKYGDVTVVKMLDSHDIFKIKERISLIDPNDTIVIID